MRSYHFIPTVLVLILTSMVANAQNNQKDIPSASERAARLTDWMKTNLQLTDDQLPKVQDINMKYANKMEDLKNSAAAKRQKLLTLKENDAAKDAELKQVFTDSQYKTYMAKKDELKKKLKQELKERKAG